MFFSPVPKNVGVEMLFAGAHEPHESLITGVLVARGPKDHFRKHGSKIDAFGGEGVNQFSAVSRIALSGEDPVFFQFAQAIRQDIGRDILFGGQELVEGVVAAEHHVAQDEERPAVAEHFDGSVQRTCGTPLRGPVFRHFVTVTDFHLHGASKIARLLGGNIWNAGASRESKGEDLI